MPSRLRTLLVPAIGLFLALALGVLSWGGPLVKGGPQGSPSSRPATPVAASPDASPATPAEGNRAASSSVPGGPPAKPTGPTAPIAAVPILMYHVIGDQAESPYQELYVRPQDFARQMQWLAQAGFQAVTLKQLYRYWFPPHHPLPPHPVVITFDDGYRSVYDNAFGVLKKLGFPATVFVVGKFLDSPYFLSPDQLKEMANQGWEIGSHTLNHIDLTAATPSQLESEVSQSKKLLQDRLGVPIDFFCYPAGRVNHRVVAATKKAGYLGAVTTRPGLAGRDHIFLLDRIRINRSDTLADFQKKLLPALKGG